MTPEKKTQIYNSTMRTIRESILSRNPGIYSHSKELTGLKTSEQFVSFLESNGYKLSTEQDSNRLMMESKTMECPMYSLGGYDRNPLTHWIKFCDYKKDKETVFFWRDEETIDKLRSLLYTEGLYCENHFGNNGKTKEIEWFDDSESFMEDVRMKLGI